MLDSSSIKEGMEAGNFRFAIWPRYSFKQDVEFMVHTSS